MSDCVNVNAELRLLCHYCTVGQVLLFTHIPWLITVQRVINSACCGYILVVCTSFIIRCLIANHFLAVRLLGNYVLIMM